MTNILILNWNSAKSTKDCLNSIISSNDKNFRVVLINNYSSISDLNEIRKIYDFFKDIIEIHLVENNENLGYAGGNNAGFNFLQRNTFSGNVLILNPDILIAENTISAMRGALSDGIGIVTVRTLNTTGKILFDAIQFKGFFQYYIVSDLDVISTDYSQGSCMLIKREIIDEIGLFDERFFLYWEEVDFSLRVKNLGQKLISITTTQIIKKNNSDSRQPLVFYYSVRNACLIKDKHRLIFSDSAYALYLLKIFLITFKFAFQPLLFIKVLANYFSAIRDSILKNYYSKSV